MARVERTLSRLGLRWRLVAALVLVSGATLGVAALTLLSPLESRLRRDELASLVNTAASFRTEFSDLTRSDITGLTPRFRGLVDDLRRRTRARIVVVDGSGQRFYDTDPIDAYFPDAAQAIASNTIIRHQPSDGGETPARIAMPVTVRNSARFVVLLRKQLSDAAAAANTVTRAFLFAALTGLGTALLLGFGIATTLLRRLRRLRQGALALAEGGLVGEDGAGTPGFDVAGHDEIADLGRAFSTMHDRLRREEQARRDFLATASHELRTPLSGLRGMLELLEEDLAAANPDLEDARRQLAKAQDQSRRLATLAADLLDLSRLDSGIDLRVEALELGELSRAVVAEFEARAGDRRLIVRPDSGSAHWARGDPGAAARILRILLDNALRYAPPGSTIEILVTGSDARAELTVIDHGPGVAAEARERIFERFQRGEDGGMGGGFGLGLAIGRELARAMGGELSLTETRSGARLQLTLPRAAGDDQAWDTGPAPKQERQPTQEPLAKR